MSAKAVDELPRSYRVSAKDRAPLINWMRSALERSGCKVITASPPNKAPFRISFRLPSGERMGIVAYAFLANSKITRNRPKDEHRFQLKYGSKEHGETHELWQDPFGLYTTLLVGVNLEEGFFVAADPVLHSPTKFFISLEFKDHHVENIKQRGWFAWERPRSGEDPIEVLVGGTADSFGRLVLLEREALGEDQGHRQLLAELAPSSLLGIGGACCVPRTTESRSLGIGCSSSLAEMDGPLTFRLRRTLPRASLTRPPLLTSRLTALLGMRSVTSFPEQMKISQCAENGLSCCLLFQKVRTTYGIRKEVGDSPCSVGADASGPSS